MSLRDAWDAQAEAWIAWARSPAHDHFFYRYNFPRFLELVPEPGRLTLDLGCGEGRVGRLLQEQGHRVVAFDGSPVLARSTIEHDLTQPVAVADVAALPVRDAVADLAVAFMSFQDVDDLEGALGEAARVLDAGGRLCLAVIHPINGAGTFPTEEPDSPFVIEGSYVESRRFMDVLERDGLAMTFHSCHHSFQTYLGALGAAGFTLEELREPVPDDEHAASEPYVARWQRVPTFLHIRAVKPM
jgi:SAM-dependent methyltransferase